MGKPYFKFKQFIVWHDKCGMKVGTDGVLIGCLAGKTEEHIYDKAHFSILDIGTGSGLIALMMAQRFHNVHILGVDIDQNAVEQAKENVHNSAFQERIEIIEMNFASGYNMLKENFGQFDLIVSNPPYYEEETYSPNHQINAAKHTQSLPFNKLTEGAASLLTADGIFCVIVPYTVTSTIISQAAINQLFLKHRYDIRNSNKKDFKRSILIFSHKCQPTTIEVITLRDENNEYSEQYKQLTDQFYL